METKLDVDAVRASVRIEDIVSQYVELKKNGREYTGLCPFHKEKSASFSINLQEKVYHCFGCGSGGDSIDFIMKIKGIGFQDAVKYIAEKYHVSPTKTYFRPKLHNTTSLSDSVVKWFKDRGISQNTVVEMKITDGKEFMPQEGKEVNTVRFNFFRGNELINTKYRDGKKNFKLVKDAELIFYNENALEAFKTIIITEGELDCLSYIEVGLNNAVSVPNGASIGKMEYLDSSIELFSDKTVIYLATDNDTPGVTLRNELIRRLGVERCRMVNFKDCKDANEYLIKYGKAALEKTISDAEQFPIDGVVSAYDVYDNYNKLYSEGLKPGFKLGIENLDSLISFEPGYLTVITGVPSHGKSQVVDFMAVLLNLRHDWKFGVFSPENFPLELHLATLSEKIIGKRFGGFNKMSPEEKDLSLYYINDNFYFIYPKDEEFTLDNILEKGRALVSRHGIKGLIIDPWNKIEHHMDSSISETNYISKQLDKITAWAKRNGVHVFLVAHPTKIKRMPNGLYETPSLYDIAGSRAFFEKTDIGITVYRDFDSFETQVHIQKCRFRHWGKQGTAVLKWNENNSRYFEIIPDDRPWIKK